MFVSTTRWSSLSLLLAISTLQPILLLPTVQSSVVHDIVRQIWQLPSSNSSSIITSNRTLANGGLLATTSSPDVSAACMSVLLPKGEPMHCLAKAAFKYPNPNRTNVENSCKATYYAVDCLVAAACEYCNDTKAVIEDTRKDVASVREECKPWSSAEPALKCPSNALLIVLIIISVIGILAVIGIVVIYCLYFYSDKSDSSSSSKDADGSHGSNKPSDPNQLESSVEAKQSSCA